MKIERKSFLTGNTTTLDLDVTEDQLNAWQQGYVLIQDAMPNLTPDEREFIKTGLLPEDWEILFPEDDMSTIVGKEVI